MKAKNIALILDSCHSGGALGAEGWRYGPMNSRGLAQLAWEKGMDILTASQSEQTAKEMGKYGHGLLTYCLLEGFQDSEIRREDGSLYAGDWLEYASNWVPKIAGGEEIAQGKRGMAERSVILVKYIDSGNLRDRLNVQTPRVFRRRADGEDWIVAK